MAGKRHLDGNAEERGFGRVDFQFAGQGGGSTGAGNYWHESFGPTRYITDHIGDKGAGYVEDFGRKKQPFFIYWTPTAPHWPLHAFTADMKKYRGIYDAGPKAIAEARYKRQVQMGLVNPAWPWKPPDYVDADAGPKRGKIGPRESRRPNAGASTAPGAT
jgi:arylsulfatase A-like enzyme